MHETDAGLHAEFSGRQANAAAWLKLMSWNDDGDAKLAQCKGPAVNVQGGRIACAVPLWIESPKPSQPNG